MAPKGPFPTRLRIEIVSRQKCQDRISDGDTVSEIKNTPIARGVSEGYFFFPFFAAFFTTFFFAFFAILFLF